ncbi:hypothetical protein [Hyphomonas pacifica]|uniref:Uncharacterized protein n=2 Tax=Hyphomonas pacifica TaxID=1280941 RepID=A0A062U0F6_9PROT|nr:hypothetical protein [Hyphomonas pacifica]KCZ51203.1 hypothetical protein HY2_12220 [Hyphomonas pacifica]RAN33682.1 hypothetical protein HY3_12320 [Hyphomonas pacifica]RAN35547.1 hypothetical protein HY11_13650 [Hyphomonas pacifica]
MSAKLLTFQPRPSERPEAMKHQSMQDFTQRHTQVSRVAIDGLLESGDPDDVISMLHRQQSWLAMMQDRLTRG